MLLVGRPTLVFNQVPAHCVESVQITLKRWVTTLNSPLPNFMHICYVVWKVKRSIEISGGLSRN